ncbi:translin family protein [Coprinopsis cinerea AmutBmut pab1-1]|nr:translin family protein [Coprinopsis cinerea AmutBmut pab1-1]
MAFKPAFEAFREELDDYNDRRERLIKASRDITNLSKKTIFLLHRLTLEREASNDGGSEEGPSRMPDVAKQGYEKLRQVQDLYASLRPELVGDLYWRHERQVSPGLQEYIEALGFAYYLEHGTLIPFNEVQKTLSDPHGAPYFPLTVSDYLLGLSDLTGELMRYAISGLSRKGGRKRATEICVFVRNCKADFERYTPYIRDLRKKQAVTSNSLEKIEDAVYAIFLRSSEYDLPAEILDDIVAQSISNFSRSEEGGGGGHSNRRSGRGRTTEGYDSGDEEGF